MRLILFMLEIMLLDAWFVRSCSIFLVSMYSPQGPKRGSGIRGDEDGDGYTPVKLNGARMGNGFWGKGQGRGSGPQPRLAP